MLEPYESLVSAHFVLSARKKKRLRSQKEYANMHSPERNSQTGQTQPTSSYTYQHHNTYRPLQTTVTSSTGLQTIPLSLRLLIFFVLYLLFRG